MQARQHGHLRARLHLEHADGVGARNHVVDARVFLRNVGEREGLAAEVRHQREPAAQRRQHAEAEHVHFQQAELIEIVLVPFDDRAIGHGGVFDGHQLFEQPLRDHEAADVLGQVPRKSLQLAGQVQQQPDLAVAGLETGLAHALFIDRGVPPLHGARETFGLHGVEPHHLGHVAQCAARPIADDRGRERGAIAAVLAIDVLDDLFAPLVFEVDVDVGRLVALARNETLHEQLAARRIHLGDAERITHHRVGGRTPALAEDVEAARLAHDVVHREEVGLVGELVDERELVVDLRAHLRRNACRPALARAGFRELAQMRSRRFTGRHQLTRIFVAQLIEREVRERGDLHGFREQLGWIEPREPRALAQVPFAIGMQPCARLGHRDAVTNRGERILQAAPLAHVHVHVAGGGQRQAVRARRARGTAPAVRDRGHRA